MLRIVRGILAYSLSCLTAALLSPLASHHHIGVVAPAMGTDDPLMPFENRSLVTVPPRHFGGIGLNLISAFETPNDEPNTGSRRSPDPEPTGGVF
jgi:hypothetical protein